LLTAYPPPINPGVPHEIAQHLDQHTKGGPGVPGGHPSLFLNSRTSLDLNWRREDCLSYLTEHGWGDTPRSACVGCPYRSDAEWARLRERSPSEWDDAVAFDAAIRHGSARATAGGHPMRGQYFLHAQRIPLDQVTLRPRPPAGDEDRPGCGPWTYPHTDLAPAAAGSAGVA
jgi:hypothetical protein